MRKLFLFLYCLETFFECSAVFVFRFSCQAYGVITGIVSFWLCFFVQGRQERVYADAFLAYFPKDWKVLLN